MKGEGQVIWPVSIRVMHWLVALITLLNALVLEGGPAHRYLGYLAVVAVLIRIMMGFFSTGHVRFSHFPISVSHIKNFLKTHFRKGDDYAGHNPLAAIVYLLMWTLIAALGATGWMLGLDAFWGEEWLEGLHKWTSDALLALVALHLMGVAMDAFIYKRQTWLAMIRGHKISK